MEKLERFEYKTDGNRTRMKKNRILPWFILPVLLSGCLTNIPIKSPDEPIALAAASETAPDPVEGAPVFVDSGADFPNPDATPIPAGTTFDSPWRYCEAVYTIDSPGIEYVGEKPPAAVRKTVTNMVGVSESDGAAHSIVWRCMDGQVYACDVTASTHCLTKMKLLTQPSQAMVSECSKAENEGLVLPVAVTGPETPYEWTCTDSVPTITRQGITVDPRGFNANIWYLIYEK